MEILAPCGGPEHVTAAVHCGADAVYLGAPALSARRNAVNFTPGELETAVGFCHQNGVKVYLTVNTLVFDGEADELRSILGLARELSVDAIIVQDWGVADFIRKKIPGMPLHASTQTGIHTPAGAVMARRMGFERVVLARELSREQIGEIIRAGDIGGEVFVHGALCAGVSGQCYFSAMLGSRSGNRGLCAQPCRLEYRCAAENGTFSAGALSLKDLSLIERMAELTALGVVSLKIEGRMKRPEYVAAAVTACRAALDGVPPDMETLAAVYARSGFTDGYFTGSMRGMGGVRRREDVVGAAPVLPGLRQLAVRVVKRRPLEVSFSLKQGEPAKVTAVCKDVSLSVEGDIPQLALRRETTASEAREQMSRLGGTPYELSRFTSDIAPGLMLPLSAQNGLRRSMVAALDRSIRAANTPRYGWTEERWNPIPPSGDRPRRFIRAECRTWEQWEAAREAGAWGSLPPEILLAHCVESSPENLLVSPPRWMAGREAPVESDLRRLYARGFRHLLCHNIAHAELGRRIGYVLHGGFGLNVTNSRSADTLVRLGFYDLTLSAELTLRQRPGGCVAGRVVYGRLPFMLLTRCPVRDDALRAGCAESCPGLTDRTGRRLALRCDGHYAELLNADTLWMADRLDEIRDDFLVLLLHDESREETLRVITAYQKGGQPPASHTRGLLYRGVE